MRAAYETGMEICRYGWISDGNVTIVRQKPNILCRANQTGLFIIKPVDPTNDAFCYDETVLSPKPDDTDKNCTSAINLESTLDPEPTKPREVITVLPTTAYEKNLTGDPTDNTTAEGLHPTTEPNEVPEATPAPTTSHSEDKEESVGDSHTTQFHSLVETTEPAETNESLTTESAAQPEPQSQQTGKEGGAKERAITSMPTLESTSSGMGDPDGIITEPGAVTTMDEEGFPGTSVSPKGRGKMMLPPNDKSNDGSSDWLIIVGVIVAVAVILLVCAAVATRKRWCGKRQTLMITSKSSSEGNGAAASATSSRAQEREQEMVTLMHKEKIQENGNTEEFTVITLEESPEKSQQA
ncbi:hypothetical protein NFI96_030972 [Prochilodus magdalenae]|nr:hypothetical protein NFI96_030972 [Prochilodus magdalenae]